MPEEVRVALAARGLTDLYAARPAYQRNDYLMWINSAKRAETKAKRLAQMLDELERGGVYMNMKWTG
ncbi:YdeI/OmpD-associated family protein [Devosia sp. PTR5]|uniref:YdeI/OmpD-associated family protein n=2 Tax=Devosia oryzisoli TaxID=2774138 RepID=A0A927IRZ0_9HYPH|nr:YdeI/OmpD-associated family protein [Devosia oryzisoli]